MSCRIFTAKESPLLSSHSHAHVFVLTDKAARGFYIVFMTNPRSKQLNFLQSIRKLDVTHQDSDFL